MKSFFFKNFILTACLFVLSFLLFGVTLFFTGRAYIIEEKRQNMYTSAEEVEHAASAFRMAGGLNNLDLRMNLSSIARSTGNHIFLCDPRGVVVSCSDMEWVCPHIGSHLSPDVMQGLRENGVYEGLTSMGGFYENEHFLIGDPIITWDGRFRGYVFVGYDPSGFMDVWGNFMALFITVSVLVLTAAMALEWVTSSRRAKPLQEMAQAAHSFSKGNYAARVQPYRGENEIAELTASFNSMAESLERNESLRRELIANVAHELRTPMTTISGFADGILDGTIAPEDEKKYLQAVSSETKRLSRLVRSMLDMSRLQDEAANRNFAPYDHSELLLQVLLNFESRINQKKLEVRLEIPEEHLFALGNVDALTRVVYNILDNAVKFSAAGTELSLHLWRQGGKLYTRIQNHGESIAPEELPLIFDRFHKADRSRSRDRDGVGLGLYMVKAILDAHDQDIFVTSENGVTAFTFTVAETQPNP